jgi:hypothetical protein
MSNNPKFIVTVDGQFIAVDFIMKWTRRGQQWDATLSNGEVFRVSKEQAEELPDCIS